MRGGADSYRVQKCVKITRVGVFKFFEELSSASWFYVACTIVVLKDREQMSKVPQDTREESVCVCARARERERERESERERAREREREKERESARARERERERRREREGEILCVCVRIIRPFRRDLGSR